jgi:hypothetical protein
MNTPHGIMFQKRVNLVTGMILWELKYETHGAYEVYGKLEK